MSEREDLILYRLDELKEDFNALRQEIRERHNDHEQRIRKLESAPRNGKRYEFWASIVALASSIIAMAMAKFRG